MHYAIDYYTQKIIYYQSVVNDIKLLLTYDNNISDDDIHYLFNNIDMAYACSPIIKSRGFTHLQKCVTLTNKYPKINNYLVEYLAKNSDDVNKLNKKGWSALHVASRNSNTTSSDKTVEILVNAGADLNIKNNFGFTPLHCAVLFSKTDSTDKTVKLLIDAGADLSIKNNNGYTVLHLAALNSKTTSTEEIVKILINMSTIKTYLNAQNKFGFTALHCAVRNSRTTSSDETVKMLINAGADLNIQSYDGSTPLHRAIRYYLTESTYKTVKLLMNQDNIDINIVDKYNKTPLDYLSDEFKSILMNKINSPLINECQICLENANVIDCKYNHHTCVDCIFQNNKLTCAYCSDKLLFNNNI